MGERKFYNVTRKRGSFEISRYGEFFATLSCKKVEQYSIALVAEQESGKKSVYLPVCKKNVYLPVHGDDYKRYDSCEGLVCVKENVEQVLYYHDPTVKNDGVLIMQVSTGEDCGYWTAINLEGLSYCLTEESAQEVMQETFTIPYTGKSCASIRHEFDYLQCQCILKIDSKLYVMDTEKRTPLVRGLGAVKIEPISLNGAYHEYFKVISDKGESFESFSTENIWGPFHEIKGTEIIDDSEFYFGLDEKGRVCEVFYNMAHNNSNENSDIATFRFEEPVEEMKTVDVLDSAEGSFAIWRLKYAPGKDKQLFLCSITNTSSLQYVMNPKEYF